VINDDTRLSDERQKMIFLVISLSLLLFFFKKSKKTFDKRFVQLLITKKSELSPWNCFFKNEKSRILFTHEKKIFLDKRFFFFLHVYFFCLSQNNKCS